jgi:hypothetical protein
LTDSKGLFEQFSKDLKISSPDLTYSYPQEKNIAQPIKSITDRDPKPYQQTGNIEEEMVDGDEFLPILLELYSICLSAQAVKSRNDMEKRKLPLPAAAVP